MPRPDPSVFIALLCVFVALAGVGCPRTPPPKPLPVNQSLGGVTLRVLGEPLPMGPRVGARRGDFLFESSTLRATVRNGGELSGALLDVTAGAWTDDALGDLAEMLELDGKLVALAFGSLRASLGPQHPVLLVERTSIDSRVGLSTRIEAIPGENRISVSTEVVNRGSASLRVRVGDRLRWFGAAPFAPGTGYVEKEAKLALPWFARANKAQTFALVCESSDCDVRFRTLGQGVDEQTALSKEAVLAPAGTTTVTRSFLAVEGTLANAAELAWRLRRVPIGYVTAKLTPAPTWAIVEARNPEGKLVLSLEVKDGNLRLPLPVGSYVVTLRGPGGRDQENVDVRANSESVASFLLPTAARLLYRVVDDSGKPIPARLIFRGVHPTLNPDLGPWHLARGANVACSATGEGSEDLPPGRYKVLVARGIEYDLFEQEISVTAEEGAVLRATLHRVVNTTGFVSADLHLHADPSGDSEVPLRDRVISLLGEGVGLVAATDHNHITDYGPTVAELGASEHIATMPGIELTTSDWGHFNAYPYPTTLTVPPVSDTAPDALFAFVRSTQPGATIQVNHPRMGEIGYFNAAKLDDKAQQAPKPGFSWDFDALEVFNGFDLMQPDVVENNMREWLRLMKLGHRYTAVGNSDSHRVVYEWAGYPRTYLAVKPEGASPESAMTSLKEGRAIVTAGPFIRLSVAGGGPGDTVKATGDKVRVDVDITAPAWLGISNARVWVDGEPRAELDISQVKRVGQLSRLHQVLEISVKSDTMVIATARAEGMLTEVLPGTKIQPHGFTNPVFIDADGDGRVTLTPP